MTNFTPSERKYVAETTMPAPCDLPWYIHEDGTIERESWTQSGFMQWNPETNDTQFRALDDWVMDCRLCTLKIHSTDEINPDFEGVYFDYFYCGNGEIEGTGFSSVDAKIAAVLANKQSSESGEVDCG